MLSSLRGTLLVVGVVLPLLKLFGLPYLAYVSWLLTFTPLIAWAILFVIAFLFMLGVLGTATGVLTLSKSQRVL